jgi:hypothetical protein
MLWEKGEKMVTVKGIKLKIVIVIIAKKVSLKASFRELTQKLVVVALVK